MSLDHFMVLQFMKQVYAKRQMLASQCFQRDTVFVFLSVFLPWQSGMQSLFWNHFNQLYQDSHTTKLQHISISHQPTWLKGLSVPQGVKNMCIPLRIKSQCIFKRPIGFCCGADPLGCWGSSGKCEIEVMFLASASQLSLQKPPSCSDRFRERETYHNLEPG